MSTLELHYSTYTQGTDAAAPWVLFLPGSGCGGFIYDEALRYFLPDYKVMMFHNPGLHGTDVPLVLSVEDIANQVCDVLAHAGIERCHVIGHSLGGFVAQEVAHMAPEVVDKLVLVSASYGGEFTQRDLKRLSRDVGMDVLKAQQGYDDSHEALVRPFVAPQFIQREPEKFNELVALHTAKWAPRSVVMRHLNAGVRFSSMAYVSMLQQPTLVVHGDEDRLVAPEGGRLLAQALPHARLWRVADCGHFPMFETIQFYPRIVDFLRGDSVGDDVPHMRVEEPRHWHEKIWHDVHDWADNMMTWWSKK